MAKESGLGWTTLNVDDDGGTARDLRSPTTNLDFSTPYNLQDITGIDSSAMERLSLLADCTGTLNGVFDPGTNSAHAVFSGDLRVIRTLTIAVSSQTLPVEVLLSDYPLSRGADGAFTWAVPFSLADGTVPTWA